MSFFYKKGFFSSCLNILRFDHSLMTGGPDVLWWTPALFFFRLHFQELLALWDLAGFRLTCSDETKVSSHLKEPFTQ